MKASIIIPTYNRKDILSKCLAALKKQTFKDFEVIIVDDGSSYNTKEIFLKEKELNLKYLYQEHKQQGAARNRGVKIAKGKYVLFIGDDIIPKENWLEEHINYHSKNKNCAVLGLSIWHPAIKINKFMNYLAPNGPQFNYGKIKNYNNCGWDFFWTSNISLEKKWFDKDIFDESFRGWGYEDLELGYRLQKKGLRIVFNPKAIAYHLHSYEYPEEFLKKQENAAKSALYFLSKHPELKKELIECNKIKPYQKIMLSGYNLLPLLKNIPSLDIIYWKLKRRYYFSKGLNNGKNKDNTHFN